MCQHILCECIREALDAVCVCDCCFPPREHLCPYCQGDPFTALDDVVEACAFCEATGLVDATTLANHDDAMATLSLRHEASAPLPVAY